jgi:hypothetical protein
LLLVSKRVIEMESVQDIPWHLSPARSLSMWSGALLTERV